MPAPYRSAHLPVPYGTVPYGTVVYFIQYLVPYCTKTGKLVKLRWSDGAGGAFLINKLRNGKDFAPTRQVSDPELELAGVFSEQFGAFLIVIPLKSANDMVNVHIILAYSWPPLDKKPEREHKTYKGHRRDSLGQGS